MPTSSLPAWRDVFRSGTAMPPSSAPSVVTITSGSRFELTRPNEGTTGACCARPYFNEPLNCQRCRAWFPSASPCHEDEPACASCASEGAVGR